MVEEQRRREADEARNLRAAQDISRLSLNSQPSGSSSAPPPPQHYPPPAYSVSMTSIYISPQVRIVIPRTSHASASASGRSLQAPAQRRRSTKPPPAHSVSITLSYLQSSDVAMITGSLPHARPPTV